MIWYTRSVRVNQISEFECLVDRELIDLHLTLLRKLTFKSARMEVWEKYLLKFCSLAPALKSEYLQLERYGYLHTTAATKLAIFKALCESQFDFNLKFKENVSSVDALCFIRGVKIYDFLMILR